MTWKKNWGLWKLQELPGGTVAAARRHIRMQIGGFGCWVWSRHYIGSGVRIISGLKIY